MKPPASLDAVLSEAEAYTQINTDDIFFMLRESPGN